MSEREFYPDADPVNADWTKQQAWDFPPYKSAAFMEGLVGTLDEFRQSPAYKAAVEGGLILDDEWVEDWLDARAPVIEPSVREKKRRQVHVHIHKEGKP